MPAPDEAKRLIDKFSANLDAYKSGAYQEAQVRQEFIDPLFQILGWDMENVQGYAEAYKEVVHEDSVRVGGAMKAPDYSFRIGGSRKFFLEAKKPSVYIKGDPAPAFQVRRYAWSAKLALSILTDFEEFAVYDCAVKPDKDDASSTARVMYLTFGQYESQWDDIAGIFSREAVLKGSFDKYASSHKKKRGTTQVDNAFLEEIEDWRMILAKNIALRNPALSQRELNQAVQVTVDRIIFLRICEDRGIEHYGRLQALLNGENVYERLKTLFRQADERYNSGLFHFQAEKGRPAPDQITLGLTLDDRPLKDIFRRLYYPDSPYEFSVISADILGQVYERFLGKVIRLTAGHHAKVEEKPEVKKAGGVYYTPTYIVDYIVKNTVGKLLEGKTPEEAASLKILDPACGSGSFLIGAYQYLLDWHVEYYRKSGPAKHRKEVYETGKNEWRLATAEKKRILLNNIYGVDIDSQAVEVTKLSLLLKVLEGENGETLDRNLRMLHQRALPDLENNIKCGNSLIGPDFYSGKNLSLLDEEEKYRVNVFDWKREFPGIFAKGGFDAVIGNPPYVRQESLGDDFKGYVAKNYTAFAGTADLYVYFIEKAHSLLRPNGLFGMICSSRYIRSNYARNLRSMLKDKTELRQIVDFGELPVFESAATFPSIILTKNAAVIKQNFIYAPIKRLDFDYLESEIEAVGSKLDSRSLEGENWTLAKSGEIGIIGKMRTAGVPLGEYVKGKIFYGIKTGLNEAFVIDGETRNRLIKEDAKSNELIKPFLMGKDIKRYGVNFQNRFLILIPDGWTRKNFGRASGAWRWFKDNYSAIAGHLEQYRQEAEIRTDKGEYWWELRACAYYQEFEKSKIIIPDVAKESRIAFSDVNYYFTNTVYFIPTQDLFLIGILNSKAIFAYFKRNATIIGDADNKGRLRWFIQDIEKIPIRVIDHKNPADKKKHDRMVELVEGMLALNKQLDGAKTAHDKAVIQRQIDATDSQIDRLVYDLYGLTEDEIRIVEESSR